MKESRRGAVSTIIQDSALNLEAVLDRMPLGKAPQNERRSALINHRVTSELWRLSHPSVRARRNRDLLSDLHRVDQRGVVEIVDDVRSTPAERAYRNGAVFDVVILSSWIVPAKN